MDGFALTKLCIQFDFGRSNAVAKSVLVALASHYSEDNGKVWPGSDVLCREAACQRNALFAAIKWLRETGLIETKRTWTGNVYTFNCELIRQGSFSKSIESNTSQSIENDTTDSIENDTSVSIGNDTTLSIESDTYESNASATYQSIESDTQTNKEQIKEQKKETEDFSSMTDSELIDFFSAVSHEDGIEARAEYTRRVLARNKRTMRPDFEQPDRPQYEILGMHH